MDQAPRTAHREPSQEKVTGVSAPVPPAILLPVPRSARNPGHTKVTLGSIPPDLSPVHWGDRSLPPIPVHPNIRAVPLIPVTRYPRSPVPGRNRPITRRPCIPRTEIPVVTRNPNMTRTRSSDHNLAPRKWRTNPHRDLSGLYRWRGQREAKYRGKKKPFHIHPPPSQVAVPIPNT